MVLYPTRNVHTSFQMLTMSDAGVFIGAWSSVLSFWQTMSVPGHHTYPHTPLVAANGLRWQRRQEVQDVMANSTGVRFQRKVSRVRSEPSRCFLNLP